MESNFSTTSSSGFTAKNRRNCFNLLCISDAALFVNVNASTEEGLPPSTRKRSILEQINQVFPLPAQASTTKETFGSQANVVDKTLFSLNASYINLPKTVI